MEIWVNTEKLDFSLEQEKNLAEVMKSLSKWVHQARYFIDGLKINGKEWTIQMAAGSTLPVGKIEKIELSVKGNMEQVEEVIPVLENYIQRFILEIGRGKEVFCLQKREKIEGLLWIADSALLLAETLGVLPRHIFRGNRNLEEVLSFLKLSVGTLTEYIHDSDFFYNYFQEGVKEKLERLLNLLEDLIDFYNYIAGSNDSEFIQRFVNESSFIEETLKKVPEVLQEGRDRDALGMIQKVMYFLEAFSIVLSRTPMEEERKEKVAALEEELVELLREMYESFRAQDIVSVSDIAEYELSERLEELCSVVKNSYQLN